MQQKLSEQTRAVERISEAYAEKFDINRDDSWFMLKLQEEVGELTQAFLAITGGARPKGRSAEELAEDFAAELSDVYCHTLLLANRFGIDLETAIQAKWMQWA